MNVSEELRSAFLSRTAKTPNHWLWGGSYHRGYPVVYLYGTQTRAVYIALGLQGLDVPPDHQTKNTCGDLSCVRPEHYDIVHVSVLRSRPRGTKEASRVASLRRNVEILEARIAVAKRKLAEAEAHQ